MTRIPSILLVLLLLCSCTTIEIQAPKAGAVNVTADKNISTSPSVTPSVTTGDNTVPVSSTP